MVVHPHGHFVLKLRDLRIENNVVFGMLAFMVMFGLTVTGWSVPPATTLPSTTLETVNYWVARHSAGRVRSLLEREGP